MSRFAWHVMDPLAHVVSRASWKDETLVIEETMMVGNHPARSTLSLSLDPKGALVLVDGRRVHGGGEEFPGPPRRLVFAKP